MTFKEGLSAYGFLSPPIHFMAVNATEKEILGDSDEFKFSDYYLV